MLNNLCPCCSALSYADCCQPFHLQLKPAPTPIALMRSRYAAYVLQLIDYLIKTTHPSTRKYYDQESIKDWSVNNEWLKLEIISAHNDQVEFKAHFKKSGKLYTHYERSFFKREEGVWYYLEGEYE